MRKPENLASSPSYAGAIAYGLARRQHGRGTGPGGMEPQSPMTVINGEIRDRPMKWLAVLFALFCAVMTQSAMAQTEAPATPVPATSMTPTPDDRAKQWLTLVDDSNYVDSYKQMGSAATRKISSDAWTQKVEGTRAPLGAMSSRNLKDVKISKTLPGMPGGQYATVRYDSAFAHKAAAVETVTLTSDKDGWSVIGYTIN
jgi:Protein of unknown function (DUF4019)